MSRSSDLDQAIGKTIQNIFLLERFDQESVYILFNDKSGLIITPICDERWGPQLEYKHIEDVRLWRQKDIVTTLVEEE